MEEGGINCGQLPLEQHQNKPSGYHFSCLGRLIQQKQTQRSLRCAGVKRATSKVFCHPSHAERGETLVHHKTLFGRL